MSMHYTENYHLNVLSPELDLLNHNQFEENINLDRNETPLRTDFEKNAVIPLDGDISIALPLKFDIYDVKRKPLIDTGACANAMVFVRK